MVDRIDIFGDDETLEEPEVPKFLGVEQTALDKGAYQSGFVDFFSQYYGMGTLGDTLKDTGISVDEDKDDITELATPGISPPTDGKEDYSNLDNLLSDPGSIMTPSYYGDTADMGLPANITADSFVEAAQHNSYTDYLKEAGFNDRVPMVENLYDPFISGRFSDIDLVEAFTGTYEGVKTDVEEAPSKIGDLISAGLKGELTPKQTSTIVSGLFAKYGGPMGMMVSTITSGETMKDSFGRATFRPSNPLFGLAFDLTMAQEFKVSENIKAAEAMAKHYGLKPGEFDTGFKGLFGNNGKVLREASSGFYIINNVPGLTQSMARAYDAFSKGFTHTSFDPTTGKGTTLEEAGFVPVGYRGVDGKDLTGQKGVGGYYTDTGSYVDKFGRGAAYGTTASMSAAAAKAGLTYSEMEQAVFDARNGKGTVGSNVRDIQQAKLDKAEADRIAEEQRKAAEEAAARAREFEDRYGEGAFERGGGGDDFGYGAGGGDFDGGREGRGFGGDEETDDPVGWATGGKVGYAMGTPAPGVPAQPSGFIDAPPSQVADGQKVADNRDMEVKEGTYVLNAAAVEFAGEQDIRKMIMDAQKEAVRRGLSTEDFERHSDLIDIAVSSGEVTIAPHLVKIIGEDRLEKINKRGLRKTEQRIQRAEAQRPQADRPVPVNQGGFISKKKFHRGGDVGHSHIKAAIDPSILGGRDGSEYGDSMTQETYEETFASPLKAQHQRKSLTPKFASQAEEKAYRQGVEFGDREVFADILGRTNYNALIQAAARDTRTLSDTVTTLRPKERIQYPYANNPLGLYSGRGVREYRPTLLQHPYYGDDKVSSSERYDRYRAANEPRITDSSIIMRSPTEFGGTAQSSRFSGSYNATLAHELMHKGADILLNIPEYSAGTVLQDIFKGLDEASDVGSLSPARRGAQSAEHRYIVGVVGQAYMKSEIESALGTFEKSQRAPKGFEDSFKKLSDSDRGNEIKRIFSKEMDRVYKLYLTPDQKQQLILENPTVLAPFSTDREKSTGYYFGKGERSSESYIGLKDDIENIPLEDVAKAYQSLNRLMTEDYATQLFERAVVDEPYVTPRIESDNKPYVPRRETSEPKYERGFLDKMLGVTPAY